MQTQKTLSSKSKLTVKVIPQQIICQEADEILKYLKDKKPLTNAQKIQQNIQKPKKQWFESSSSDFEGKILQNLSNLHETEQNQLLRAVRIYKGHSTQKPLIFNTEKRSQQRLEQKKVDKQKQILERNQVRHYHFSFEQNIKNRPFSQLQDSKFCEMATWKMTAQEKQKMHEMKTQKLSKRVQSVLDGASVGQYKVQRQDESAILINQSNKEIKVKQGLGYGGGVGAAFKKVANHAPEWKLCERGRVMYNEEGNAGKDCQIGPGFYETVKFQDQKVEKQVRKDCRRILFESQKLD